MSTEAQRSGDICNPIKPLYTQAAVSAAPVPVLPTFSRIFAVLIKKPYICTIKENKNTKQWKKSMSDG
jgi:hypothetical protein